MAGRQLNFTTLELREMMDWPEALHPLSRSFAERLERTYGVRSVKDEDDIVRWEVPKIPCALVPRIGPVDRQAVLAEYGENEMIEGF